MLATAIDLLRKKLTRVKAHADRWRVINRAACAKEPAEALAALSLTAEELRTLKFSPAGTAYVVKNANAEIRRIKNRIANLETRATEPIRTEVIGGIKIDETEHRVRIHFTGKPAPAVRIELKRAGFRWTPTEGVWQRHASASAWIHASRCAELHATSATSTESTRIR